VKKKKKRGTETRSLMQPHQWKMTFSNHEHWSCVCCE